MSQGWASFWLTMFCLALPCHIVLIYLVMLIFTPYPLACFGLAVAEVIFGALTIHGLWVVSHIPNQWTYYNQHRLYPPQTFRYQDHDDFDFDSGDSFIPDYDAPPPRIDYGRRIQF